MSNSQVMTVARVFEPNEDGTEVVFLESAMFYRLPRETPAFDSMVAVLKNAQANGEPVRVDLAPDSDNIIESVEEV
jgi:hypothetical protein